MRGSTSRFLPGLALVLSLAAPALLAPAAGAAVTVKDPGTYVVDTAGLIDAGTERRVEGWLRELEQKTTAQVKILTVPTTDGEDIVGFAQRHAEAWKLGRKGKDNGAPHRPDPQGTKGSYPHGLRPGGGTARLLGRHGFPTGRRRLLQQGQIRRRVAGSHRGHGQPGGGHRTREAYRRSRLPDPRRPAACDRHRHRRFADTGAAGAVLPELATPPASSHRLGRPGRGFRPSDGSGSREPPRRRRAFLGRLGRRSRGRLRRRPRRFLRRRRGLWRGRGRSRVVNT